MPRAIASDGAPELREPIGMRRERLPKTPGESPQKPLAIRDPKHFLANQLEAQLTRDPAWLRAFAPNLREWQACQAGVDTALKFLNERGLFHGATQQLQKLVAKFEEHPLCQQLIKALVKFVQGSEDQLQTRAVADEHRNSGIVLREVAATGTAAFPRRLHQLAADLPRATATDDRG